MNNGVASPGQARTGGIPKGCIWGGLLISVAVSIVGYYAWKTIQNYMPPEDLRPFTYKSETLKNVESKAPRPGSTERLSEDDLEFYLGSFDSVNVGWQKFSRLADSVIKAKDDEDELIIWEESDMIREFLFVPLYSRRSLVNYLNAQGRSWEEYMWAKERAVAATDITEDEVLEAAKSILEGFDLDGTNEAVDEIANDNNDGFFAKVEALRSDNGIDSAEAALVLPHRETMMTKGLQSLMNTEAIFFSGSSVELEE